MIWKGLVFAMKALKRAAALLAACALCVPLFSGCGKSIDPSTIEYIQLEQPKEGEDIAIVDTSMGEITVLLYTDEVPGDCPELQGSGESGLLRRTDRFPCGAGCRSGRYRIQHPGRKRRGLQHWKAQEGGVFLQSVALLRVGSHALL